MIIESDLDRVLEACNDIEHPFIIDAAVRAEVMWRCEAPADAHAGAACGWINRAKDAKCAAGDGCKGKRPFKPKVIVCAMVMRTRRGLAVRGRLCKRPWGHKGNHIYGAVGTVQP